MKSLSHRFLESLQARIHAHDGTTPERYQSEEILLKGLELFLAKRKAVVGPGRISDMRQSLQEQLMAARSTKTPTRFQDPMVYSLMSSAALEVEDAARRMSLTISRKPSFGSLPSRQVNARTIAVPGSSEYLVVFEEGLYHFTDDLSKIVFQVAPLEKVEGGWTYSTEEDRWIDSIERHPEIRRLFHQALSAYLLLGRPPRPDSPEQYYIEEPYSTLAELLAHSVELFVIAHEYAHVILGHLSETRLVASAIGGEPVEEITRNWEEEFEADTLGFKLASYALAASGFGLSASMQGTDFFFSCIDIVERGLSILRTGSDDWREPPWGSTSHPPTAWRRDMIRKWLAQGVPPDNAEPALRAGAVLEFVVGVLFEMTRPVLRQDYELGKRPASIWD